QSSADLDYSSTSALTLNGGTINTMSNGQAASLTLPAPGATGTRLNSKNKPISTAVSCLKNKNSTTPHRTYTLRAAIVTAVTFSKAVNLTGTPQLALNSVVFSAYASGTGTPPSSPTRRSSDLQSSADLDYTSTSALTLNGGTITTASNGQAASLTLPAPGAAGVGRAACRERGERGGGGGARQKKKKHDEDARRRGARENDGTVNED